jgi:hypothetical protein
LATRSVLEGGLLPVLATGFQIADADAKSANFILFGGTAALPALTPLTEEARLTGEILGEGWVGHEGCLLEIGVSRVVMKST